MPEMTPHTGLKKPLESETADITVINENMDKIDSALGDLAGVPTTAKDAAGAITELHEAIQEIDVDIPDGSITPEKLSFDPATQAELDAHVNAASVHGATSAATAGRLIIRDSNGRAKVAAPVANDDVARLDSVTKTQVGLGNVDNYGTATQAEAEAGTATNKFMTPQRTKQYVDKRLFNGLQFRLNNGVVEYSVDGGIWNSMGVVKNIQRGTTVVTGHGTTNVTISAVALSKTQVNLLSVHADAGANNLSVRLTSSTNLEINHSFIYSGTPQNRMISWEVIEYY